MPRKNRLTRADFKALSPIKRLHGSFFTLSVGKTDASGVTKYACVVSKKVALRANVRNLIKRRCRTAIRCLKGLPGKTGMYIFTAKKNASRAVYADIKNDIEKLLSQWSS